jgi:hypothetical protein
MILELGTIRGGEVSEGGSDCVKYELRSSSVDWS